MRGLFYTSLLVTVMLFATSACTKKKEPKPIVTQMKGKLASMEADLVAFEDKIRRAADDPGMRNRLSEDRELLKSRIGRLREFIKREDPEAFTVEASGGGGGAHH